MHSLKTLFAAFIPWLKNLRARGQIRRLLSRPDDHLIRDIGMTRDELRRRFGVF
jgi:uncharacterized protein YjiS (DUF1127 family)